MPDYMSIGEPFEVWGGVNHWSNMRTSLADGFYVYFGADLLGPFKDPEDALAAADAKAEGRW